MANQPDYTEKQLAQIVKCARECGGLLSEKYLELLYFAVVDDDTPQNRALFGRAIRKYVCTSEVEDGSLAPSEEFSKNDLKQKMEELRRQVRRKYRLYFGVATVDGEKYLPNNITIDGIRYRKAAWGTVRRELVKHEKMVQFLNTFAGTVRLADVVAFADEQALEFTSDNFYKRLEKLLSQQLYYCVEIEALDVELATEIVDATFGKVLWAASATWAMTSQSVTWNASGELTRRAPAMMSGVYLAMKGDEPDASKKSDIADGDLVILQDTNRKVKAEQKFLTGNSAKSDEKRLRMYRGILGMLLWPQGNYARVKLGLVARVLHDALSSNDVNNRHLELWQCMELGVGWKRRREKDVMQTLKHYYNPEVEANAVWGIIGDYVHAKRCEFVHECAKLERDSFGTYDSALNLYMDYARATLMLLMYFGDSRRTSLVRDKEGFNKLMEYYAQDSKDLMVAKWVERHRRWQ